jgi:trigger factor
VTFTVPASKDGEEVPAELRDIAGQTVTVKVSVREAREKNVPAIDDDFAKDTGEADTLAELREKVREKVSQQKEREQERALRQDLIKKVLEKNPFLVAPALVDRQTDVLIHRAKMQLAMRGIDPRNVPLDENKLKQELRPSAVEEVRGLFLIDAIATKEKVEVSDADLEKRLAEMARERNKNVPRLKAELQKEGRLDQIRYQLREEKTLDLLMSRANITMKP